MAEQPRIHDSAGDVRTRAEQPAPSLSRYARAETPPQAATEAHAGEEEISPEPASTAPLPPQDVSSALGTDDAKPPTAADRETAPDLDVAAPDEPESADGGADSIDSERPSTEPELVESLPPSLVEPTGQRAPAAALVAVSPEAAETGRREKVPFWKRIALPRPIVQATQAATGRSGPALEPVLSRLSALEKQLAANQSATEIHLDRVEENITRLWELEEQMTLTEVRERLALLEANQEEIADGLHAVGRNLSILAIVLAIAVAAALLGVGLAL